MAWALAISSNASCALLFCEANLTTSDPYFALIPANPAPVALNTATVNQSTIVTAFRALCCMPRPPGTGRATKEWRPLRSLWGWIKLRRTSQAGGLSTAQHSKALNILGCNEKENKSPWYQGFTTKERCTLAHSNTQLWRVNFEGKGTPPPTPVSSAKAGMRSRGWDWSQGGIDLLYLLALQF